MRSQRGPAVLHTELVGVEGEVAGRGDARVLLPETPRGGVARVDEETIADVALTPVELLERRQRHEHLAAHLEARRDRVAVQLLRDRADGGDVGGDVLARLAVAAGGAADESTVLVEQRDGEAVELGFADERDRIGDHPLDARVPGGQLLAVEGVVEREHRHHVAHGGERGRRWRADLLERRVGGVERRVLLGEGLELTHQRVELGVGDFRFVVAVVPLAVVADLGRELVSARHDLGRNCTGCPARVRQRSRPSPAIYRAGVTATSWWSSAASRRGRRRRRRRSRRGRSRGRRRGRVVGGVVVGGAVVGNGRGRGVVDVVEEVVVVVDELVVVVFGVLSPPSSDSSSARTTPARITASTINAAISQRIPDDMPSSSSSGGTPSPPPPAPAAPPAAPPAAAAPAAAAGMAVVCSPVCSPVGGAPSPTLSTAAPQLPHTVAPGSSG